MAKQFSIYRGLQKPLVFKGFKGKFIYWGVGCLLAGLVFGAITMALVNMYLGLIVLVGLIVGGLLFTAAQQRRGLHVKDNASKVFVHQAKFKYKIIYGQKKCL